MGRVALLALSDIQYVCNMLRLGCQLYQLQRRLRLDLGDLRAERVVLSSSHDLKLHVDFNAYNILTELIASDKHIQMGKNGP